jgi:hypothetical protein
MLKKWRGKSEVTVSWRRLSCQNGIDGSRSLFARPHKITGPLKRVSLSKGSRDSAKTQQHDCDGAWKIKASGQLRDSFPKYLVVSPPLGNKPLARPAVGDSNRKKSTAQYKVRIVQSLPHTFQISTNVTSAKPNVLHLKASFRSQEI